MDTWGRNTYLSLRRRRGRDGDPAGTHVAAAYALQRDLVVVPRGSRADYPTDAEYAVLVGDLDRGRAELVDVASLEVHHLTTREDEVVVVGHLSRSVRAPVPRLRALSQDDVAEALAGGRLDLTRVLRRMGVEVPDGPRELPSRLEGLPLVPSRPEVRTVAHDDTVAAAAGLCRCCLPWCRETG